MDFLGKTDFLITVPWGLNSQNQLAQISAQFEPYVPTAVGVAQREQPEASEGLLGCVSRGSETHLCGRKEGQGG